jgi:hypothetical protein
MLSVLVNIQEQVSIDRDARNGEGYDIRDKVTSHGNPPDVPVLES